MIDPIVQTACELLEKGEKFVVASIISNQGSTPRTAGTRMIVACDGNIVGTIGGGLLEAKVIEKAVNTISETGPSSFMPFDLTYEDTASMDMICGGQATILIDLIVPSYENAGVFERWKQALERRENSFLITVVTGSETRIDAVTHCVLDPAENVEGPFSLSSEALDRIKTEAGKSKFMRVFTFDDAIAIVEPAAKPKSAFFFGAGHVAQPTVHMASLVGFRTSVLDDRAEFANKERFPDADEIHVLENFESAFDPVSVHPDSFVVIFTRGHLHDRTVLAHALKTDAAYIGMIGSKKKRDAIYNALMKSGFAQKDIDRVHSPIGLSIGAQTPEEIAVSIAAEMIRKRAAMDK